MTTKTAAASARIRGRKPQTNSGAKRRKTTPRQQRFVQGVLEGKSQRQAALDAGYSERMARHPGELLSTESLRGLCQSRLSLEKILQRIDEGMDATQSQVIVLGRKGKETIETVEGPNYFERRSAAALAAKLIGADPAAKIEVHGDVTTLVKVEFVDVATTPA